MLPVRFVAFSPYLSQWEHLVPDACRKPVHVHSHRVADRVSTDPSLAGCLIGHRAGWAGCMNRSAHNSSLGSYGERVAAQRLVDQGMVLVDRNWRCELGELDLVLRDGDVLVFCEVKTRTSTAYGHPLEAVGQVKGDRLRRLAMRWVEEHGVHPEGIRVDLVGVLLAERGAAEVEHVQGVG